MTRVLRLVLLCVTCSWAPAALAQVPDPAATTPSASAQSAPSTAGTAAAQPADPATVPPARSTARPPRGRAARQAPPPAEPAVTTPPVDASAGDLVLAPGEERITTLDGACDGVRRHPAFRLGQDQVIRKGEAVDNFIVVFGNVVVEGHVCGDLSVTLGDVRLASGSSVEGTLVVVGGTATIEPGASVGHELMLVGGTLEAPPDFRPGREQIVIGIPVVGERVRQAVPYVTRGLLLGRLIVPDIGWIWWVVGVTFFVQLLVNLLFPQATSAAAAIIAERPLSTFLAGLLVLVLSGPVATLLAVTVVGIAALPVLFGALLIAGIVGKVAVNRWIGGRVFEPEEPEGRLASTRSFAIGFVVLTILYMIPLLGIVVWGLTGVLGLGAAALAFVKAFRVENPPAVRTRPEPPPVPPPASPSPFESAALGGTVAAAAAGSAGASGEGSPLHRSPIGDAFALPPAYAGGTTAIPGAGTAGVSLDPRELLAFPLARFAERAAAFALDVLLVAMTSAMLRGGDPGDWFVLLLVAYHVAFWVWKATTVGGIICQLRVVRVDGAPLRFVDALVRGLVGIFSVATFGIGALWILRDPQRQSWHDKVAGTIVVRVPRNYPLP